MFFRKGQPKEAPPEAAAEAVVSETTPLVKAHRDVAASTTTTAIAIATPVTVSPHSSLGIPVSLSAESYTPPTPKMANHHQNHTLGENDDYVVALTRRNSRLRYDDSEGAAGDGVARKLFGDSTNLPQKGTAWGQTIVQLVKGYIGCGILSLPWAVSQLGIPLGLLAIVIMSVWTSYNCMTVARLKQYIDRVAAAEELEEEDDENETTASKASQKSAASNGTHTTYPEVGAWAYGAKFQGYVAVCICAQQLAIGTVFVGFVLENFEAALRFWDVSYGDYSPRALVTAACLPSLVLLTASLPTVQSMVPLMVLGFVSMLAGFGLLGWIGYAQWDDRPNWEDLPNPWPVDLTSFDVTELDIRNFDFASFWDNLDVASLHIPSIDVFGLWDTLLDHANIPMALCGILYSFEGICIILPIESSMQRPVRDFPSAYGCSMVVVTLLLCSMGGLCVLVFGSVSNGSITAFLLDAYGSDDPELATKIVVANLLVSVSIVLTFPLQLYPAVELLASALFDWSERRRQRRKQLRSGGDDPTADLDDEDSLGFATSPNEFAPLTGIPENRVPSMRSLPTLPHEPEATATAESAPEEDPFGIHELNARELLPSEEPNNDAAAVPDADTTRTGEATDGGGMSESASLLSRLSSNLSYQRSIVDDSDDDHDEPEPAGKEASPRKRQRNRGSEASWDWGLPGDSPLLRAVLVLGTYLVAVLVPNVQSLVSLVGAVTGSSTALLIPPILELAYISHREALEAPTGHRTSSLLGDWEGGPSRASQELLFGSQRRRQRRGRCCRYFWDKLASWFLLLLGLVFAAIGSYFSVRDILQSYTA